MVHYLKKVKTFLDANPNEVLTLLFTNPEGLSVEDVWKPAFDNSSKSSSVSNYFVSNSGQVLPLWFTSPQPFLSSNRIGQPWER